MEWQNNFGVNEEARWLDLIDQQRRETDKDIDELVQIVRARMAALKGRSASEREPHEEQMLPLDLAQREVEREVETKQRGGYER